MKKLAKGMAAIKETEDSRSIPDNNDNNEIYEHEITRSMNEGDKVKIRLLQELDEESDLYDEDYGLAFVVTEYEHPDYFWFKVADAETADGTPSWLVQQSAHEDPDKRWRRRDTLYVNAAVIGEDGAVEKGYISRSAFGRGMGAQIIAAARERGKVTDVIWSLHKKSTGPQTQNVEYVLTMTDMVDDDLPVPADDLFDLEGALRFYEAENQEKAVREFEANMAKSNSGTNGSTPSNDNAKQDGFAF